jgi:penicillin-insensitive murein endopeptidase
MAVGSLTSAAFATPRGTRSRRAEPEVSSDGTSLSVGRPHRGRLLNGALLPETPWVRYRSGTDRFRYGTDELVTALEIAAKHVSDRLPGARLTVGDISVRRGGRLRPHRSHRNGRDVDVAFYMSDAEGAPVYAPRFIRVRNDGTSRESGVEARFDDARNWELVQSLLTSELVSVQYAFVSRALEQRLIEEGRRRGAGEDLLARAETVLDQPRAGGRHDDHFHVRIYCDRDDRPRCVDPPPYHAWRPTPAEAPQLALLAD